MNSVNSRRAADAAAIAEAAALLRAGRLVAFPTETVYGLGADGLNPEAVRRIFEAKGRPANNPLILHVPDADAAHTLASGWPDAAARLTAAFWPGPLTVVVPRAVCVPDVVTAGGPTAALRSPAHPVARELIAAAGVPLAAPSANPSGRTSPTTAGHVAAGLGGRVDLILDGGPTAGGIESTVVDVSVDPPRLLRPGLVTLAELRAVVGDVQNIGTVEGPLRSPGLLAKHYAPATPLRLVGSAGEAERLIAGRGDACRLELGDDPRRAAAALYAELHRLDAAGWGLIVALEPPAGDEWAAVRDRLRRAAV